MTLSPADAARQLRTDAADLHELGGPDEVDHIAERMIDAAATMDAAQAELARLRATTGDAMEASRLQPSSTAWEIATEFTDSRASALVLANKIDAAITAAEARARQAEREECARVAECLFADHNINGIVRGAGKAVAAAICSRQPPISAGGERQAGVREGIEMAVEAVGLRERWAREHIDETAAALRALLPAAPKEGE